MRFSSLVGPAGRINSFGSVALVAFVGATIMLQARVSRAAVKSWAAASGNWTAAGNWSPVGVPGVADDVLIGPHIAAANEIVALNANAAVDSVTLTDGMTLRTSTGSLNVAGATQISGQNIVGPSTFVTRLRIENGVGGTDFTTGNLSLSNFGRATLENGASMLVSGVATIGADASLSGNGVVYLSKNSAVALDNDGRLEAAAGGLTIFQTANGRIDLDGTNGNGLVVVSAGGGAGLTLNGDQLSDPFSGDMEMGSNSLLSMNLANGWIASSSSSLTVTGVGDLPTAVVNGAAVDWAGALTVTGNHGRLRFDADVALAAATVVNVNADDELEFAEATDVIGGSYNLSSGAELRFTGDTIVGGGNFSTAGVAANSGMVSFFGPSDWQGNVQLSGRSRVNGMATVSATTTIDADQFDIDGSGGLTIWDVNAAFTVNADQIDASNNSFDGVIDVGGGLANRLTLNLSNPADSWQMMGTLNLSGVSGIYITRIAGSQMDVGGTVNVANADVNLSASVTLLDNSVVNFAASTSDLRFSGASTIHAAADFNGQGLLHNNADGDGMQIAGGVNLGQAGLANEGRLAIGLAAPGQVSVNRFSSDADASLHMFIGGTTPGTELSNLLVTGGTAQLDGTLSLSLFDDGGGFAPELGDQFAIITAPGGVVGQFDQVVQPLGMPTGLLFEVQYTPTSVVLFVDNTFEADFNRDGVVNGNDLAVWNAAYGVNNYADANNDGVSDGADFLVWQRQYGFGLPVAMATAVPEPTGVALLVISLGMGVYRRRR
ncbi:hypothetical protein I41_55080 [Lacipirellula limnantheis]|uniref:Autotransporter-associated beta strand repeat protein n=2 Tax=Lacipirellula limnantheis TaxID=2528024 RepID=A0A517U6K4_9BACT|nr:hypothetical protein I41_55080 [Lacipirellula limnantheis]